jgi:single-strand DNA-binding protein
MLDANAGGGSPPGWRALGRSPRSRVKEALMASNDAYFSVCGYVATQPKAGEMNDGTETLSFRIGWTPRAIDRSTGEWADLPSSFASVTCYRKLAVHGKYSLRRGDPVLLKGTLRVREYVDQAGVRRNSVDVVANFLGHDMTRGTSMFSKQSLRAEPTGAEYARSQAARNPLPGDVTAQQQQGEPYQAASDGDEMGRVQTTELAPEGADDLMPGSQVGPDDEDADEIDDSDGISDLAPSQPVLSPGR